MIRIKAPQVAGWAAGPRTRTSSVGEYVGNGRLYTEAMHRRVLALVRACEPTVDGTDDVDAMCRDIADAVAALRAQAEKEAK